MIHVEFRDFDDMVGFARQLMGQVQPVGAMDTPSVVQQTAMAPPAPQAPQAAQPMPAPVPTPVPAQKPVTPVPAQQPAVSVPAPLPAQQPVMPVPQTAAPVPATVPTAVASYTLDDLARAAMPLMDAGRQAELQQLLQLFGVEALPALQPGQYGAFATKLREMGAQI